MPKSAVEVCIEISSEQDALVFTLVFKFDSDTAATKLLEQKERSIRGLARLVKEVSVREDHSLEIRLTSEGVGNLPRAQTMAGEFARMLRLTIKATVKDLRQA